jgi:hypothetical protein
MLSSSLEYPAYLSARSDEIIGGYFVLHDDVDRLAAIPQV